MDILISARLARSYVVDKAWEEFCADGQCQDAVVRRLEVLGEAARRTSESTRHALPSLPWRQMIRMRNRIIHEYDRVDLAVVWDTVRLDLPALITALESIVPATQEDEPPPADSPTPPVT